MYFEKRNYSPAAHGGRSLPMRWIYWPKCIILSTISAKISWVMLIQILTPPPQLACIDLPLLHHNNNDHSLSNHVDLLILKFVKPDNGLEPHSHQSGTLNYDATLLWCKIIKKMPPGDYTITIKYIDLCLFLPVTDIVKYRKSQFYATNHKSHQNAIYLTGHVNNEKILCYSPEADFLNGYYFKSFITP